MDISKIAEVVAQSEETVTGIIYMPSREPYRGNDGEPSTVTVVGSEAKSYRVARDKITRKALRSRRRDMEPEEVLQNRIDLALAGMRGWSGWDSGNEPLPFTPENARKILVAEHILTQVEELISEHASHFLASSNGSQP